MKDVQLAMMGAKKRFDDRVYVLCRSITKSNTHWKFCVQKKFPFFLRHFNMDEAEQYLKEIHWREEDLSYLFVEIDYNQDMNHLAFARLRIQHGEKLSEEQKGVIDFYLNRV